MNHVALVLLFGALMFAFGWLVGSTEALRLKERDALDQGFAVREPDGKFRWRTWEEIERKPARRNKAEHAIPPGDQESATPR